MALPKSMRTTLESLCGPESVIHRGTTSGEVMASGGTRAALYSAVKKGWVARYPEKSQDGSPLYYRSNAGTETLIADGWKEKEY